MTTQIRQTFDSPLRPAPGIATLIAASISRAYAYVTALLGDSMRPSAESPAEAAARLRAYAHSVSSREPAFAADLYAAADRHEVLHGD